MMSQLFPFTIIGAGTAEIESLPSVIHRLAHMHNVTVGHLLRIIHEKYFRVAANASLPADFTNEIILQAFSRPNDSTRSLIQAIEAIATVSKLSATTLLPLSSALDRSLNAYAKDMRWCRICFKELHIADEPGYYKLIWSLKAVTKCHIHGIPLETECTVCGKNQNTFSYRTDALFCQKCHEPLFSQSSDDMHSYRFTCLDADLVELIGAISCGELDKIPADSVRLSLSDIFHWYWKRGKENELYELCGRDSILGIIHNDDAITLNKLRRVAFDLRESLVGLITGTASTAALDLVEPKANYTPDFKSPAKRIIRDHEKTFSLISKIVREANYPPSLKSVAEQASVSSGYITYRYPLLAEKIVKESTKYQAAQKEKRKQLAMNYAVQYFYGKKYVGHPKSRKHALRTLMAETQLPKELLRECIKQITSKVSSVNNESIS